MTAEELIEALRRMPPDAQVWADCGCGQNGCANPVTGVVVDWQNDVTIQVQF